MRGSGPYSRMIQATAAAVAAAADDDDSEVDMWQIKLEILTEINSFPDPEKPEADPPEMAAVRTWADEQKFSLALVLRGGGQGVAVPYSSPLNPLLPPVDAEASFY